MAKSEEATTINLNEALLIVPRPKSHVSQAFLMPQATSGERVHTAAGDEAQMLRDPAQGSGAAPGEAGCDSPGRRWGAHSRGRGARRLWTARCKGSQERCFPFSPFYVEMKVFGFP